MSPLSPYIGGDKCDRHLSLFLSPLKPKETEAVTSVSPAVTFFNSDKCHFLESDTFDHRIDHLIMNSDNAFGVQFVFNLVCRGAVLGDALVEH